MADTFVTAKSTLNIERSKFDLSNKHITTMLHGRLYPVRVDELVPGDTFKCELHSIIRMSTPIYPIADQIFCNYAAFFVPKRLIWNKTKQFYGEAVDGYGIAADVVEPTCNNFKMFHNKIYTGNNLSNPLGIYTTEENDSNVLQDINLLPVWAYYQIYNDWFRNQNFDQPYTWDHNATGVQTDTTIRLGNDVIWPGRDYKVNVSGISLPQVQKQIDRWTSCLPWAQKLAAPIELPIGDSAPLSTGSTDYAVNGIHLYSSTAPSVGTIPELSSSSLKAVLPENTTLVLKGEIDRTNIVADLRNATAVNVNQLRLAVQTQRYFETLARCGSFYRQYIEAFYGVRIGDTTALMAEYIGGKSFPINIDSVYQSTGYVAGKTTTLGSVGGYSHTYGQGDMFTYSAKEPGYLIIVCYFKHSRTYGQGLDDLFMKKELFDYYNPKFCHIGEQPVKLGTIFNGTKAVSDTAFGFNEAWSDYRYKRDMVTGLCNPAVQSSLEFITLADKYAGRPYLSSEWLKEDRNAIARCLSTGTNGPDYLVDSFFKVDAVRPMSVTSIPGLLDHF